MISIKKNGTPLPGSGGNLLPSEMPDLAGDFDKKKTGAPLSGSGEPIAGYIQFSDMDAPMPEIPEWETTRTSHVT